MEVDTNSTMYQAGYACSIQFSYIPDFTTIQEKTDFEAGLKEGYYHREKGDRVPIIYEKSL